MSDLISRSALIEEFVEATNKGVGKLWHITGIKALIENAPTVEAIPKEKLDEIVKRLKELYTYNSKQAELYLNEEDTNGYFGEAIDRYMDRANCYGVAIRTVKEVGRTNE